MKTPLVSLFAVALLAGCSSSKDDAQKAAAAAAIGACPTLNGKYSGVDKNKTAVSYDIATQNSGGKYSYSLGGLTKAFLQADGSTHGTDDQIVTCTTNTINFSGTVTGAGKVSERFTDRGAGHVDLLTNDGEVIALAKDGANVVQPKVDCPTINGTYVGSYEGEPVKITFATKVENGVYNYSFGEGSTFMPADGQPLQMQDDKGNPGEYRMSCGPGFVQIYNKFQGQEAESDTYSPVGNGLSISLNGREAVILQRQ